ncbi:MAG: peptidoglycan DD-metalloendopeptidase family protein [Gammaproteobacteria bacterium]
MIKKYFAVLLLFLLPIYGVALPKTDPVPGGIVMIPIHSAAKTAPKVTFQKHRVMVLKSKQGWLALVGIPLTEKTGKHKIYVNSAKVDFTIHHKDYPVQRIQLKSNKLVTPDKKMQQQMIKESRYMQKLFNTWTSNIPDTQLQLPVHGRYSGLFGMHRVFNGEPWGYHKGLDIAVKRGTPVHAAANGVVLATGKFLLTGNTVFVNHGQGLVTVYCHMEAINVHRGEHVTQKTVLGFAGMTGRATGPHVHFGVSMNGARVNPLLFA